MFFFFSRHPPNTTGTSEKQALVEFSRISMHPSTSFCDEIWILVKDKKRKKLFPRRTVSILTF